MSSNPTGLNISRDPSQLDTNALLLEIRSDVKTMNAKFENLEKSVATLKSENTLLKEENKKLLQKVEHLSTSINEVRKIATDSERRSERLEAQSRRDNLKFYGIDKKKNETWADTETKVRHEISRQGLEESSISKEREHIDYLVARRLNQL